MSKPHRITTRALPARKSAAANRRSSDATLEALAHDPDPAVRIRVARNEGVPLEVLLELCSDPHEAVREAIARRLGLRSRYWEPEPEGEPQLPQTMDELLPAAAKTGEERLSEQVVLHKDCPLEVLEIFVRRGGWIAVMAATHPNASEEIVRAVAAETDDFGLEAIARAENTPEDVLEMVVATNLWRLVSVVEQKAKKQDSARLKLAVQMAPNYQGEPDALREAIDPILDD